MVFSMSLIIVPAPGLKINLFFQKQDVFAEEIEFPNQ